MIIIKETPHYCPPYLLLNLGSRDDTVLAGYLTLEFVHNHKEELHKALKALLETSIQLVDAYVNAGADGFLSLLSLHRKIY